MGSKTQYLQLRLSPAEKAEIERSAQQANMSVSAWILSKTTHQLGARFQEIVERLAGANDVSYPLAELHDFLAPLTAGELRAAIEEPPRFTLSPVLANQIAAMIEVAAHRLQVNPPAWVASIAPLPQPVFATSLKSLRMQLLTKAPPPFRRRNIFVDATVGERV